MIFNLFKFKHFVINRCSVQTSVNIKISVLSSTAAVSSTSNYINIYCWSIVDECAIERYRLWYSKLYYYNNYYKVCERHHRGGPVSRRICVRVKVKRRQLQETAQKTHLSHQRFPLNRARSPCAREHRFEVGRFFSPVLFHSGFFNNACENLVGPG